LAIALRYAARSDVGLVRSNNQDSAYAGPHLLVVADGMGGHAGGDVASSLAIGELAWLDDESHGADALDHLAGRIRQAHSELLARVDEEPALAGMGTTVTALLRTGSRLALAHIGDSRAYLLRDEVMVQLTKDHTFVQSLIDDGRLTPEEAEVHPHRSVVMRVLSDVVDDAEPDLSMREARFGDRYLLCSDGLSGVVSFDTIAQTMAGGHDPATTCEVLVQLALRAGAPDNVTCIVADIIDEPMDGDSVPTVVGAAAERQPRRALVAANGGSPAERAAALTRIEDDDSPFHHPRPTTAAGPRRLLLGVGAAAVLLAGAGAAWAWVQGQLYVGSSSGQVAIYAGLPEGVGPLSLSKVRQEFPDVRVTDLPDYARTALTRGLPADNEAKASDIVESYRKLADACRSAAASAAASAASPSPSAVPSASATVTPFVSAAASPASPAAGGPTPGSAAAASPTASVPAAGASGLATAVGPTVDPTAGSQTGAPAGASADAPSPSSSPGCGNLVP
jgi:PPM family protein phosphatase